MARKRNTYTDNGSVGYSDEALRELMRGQYKGRESQYKTSEDQLRASRSLPKLAGMNREPETPSPEWTSNLSRNKYNGIDPARARANYAASLQSEITPDNVNDENYVVDRKRYDKLMKDSRLANDIKTLAEVNYKNANQDATVSQEWADEYGAKAITGGLSKSQFLTQLSKRYELTPEELNDMALTFHSDAYKKENEEYGKQLEKVGKDNSLLASVGSLIGTLGSGVEGVYNTAVGAIGGDDRYLSNIFSTTKNSPREGAKQNIETDFGKGAYDIAMGIGDMAAGAVAGSAPVILAGNTANEAQRSALDRGSSVRRSSLYGGLAGVADYVTNTIGLDKAKDLAVESIKKTGIKEFLKKSAVAGLGEAKENIYQDLAQSALDAIFNGENAELARSFKDKLDNGMSEGKALGEVVKEYMGQLGFSGALGFGMGSAMQAGKSTLPHLPGMIADKWAENKLNVVDPELQKYLADALGVPEENINAPRISAKSDAELQAESENISNQLQRLENGEMASNEYVTMGETPRYMQEYGDVDNPLVMPQNVPNKHGIDNAVIENLPEQFNNPVAVMRSRTQPNSGVVMTDIVDEHGNPVIVPIHMGKETGMGTVNEIPTVFGKKGAKNFINNSEVAFENKERVNEALSGNGVQFSELNDSSNPNFNSTIEQSTPNVNSSEIPQGDVNSPKLEIEDEAFARGVENANADNSFSRMNALFEGMNKDNSEIPPSDVNNADVSNAPTGPTDPNMGESRVVTNSAINAGIISRYDYENDPVLRELASYAKHNNEQTYANALENVRNNGETLLDDYNNDRRVIDNDQDVDQAMLLLRNLNEQMKANPEDIEGLTAQRNMLLSRLRKAGTKWGQSVQAFAKWNDTADGAMINADKMNAERAEIWESQNQEQAKVHKKIAEELDAIGKDIETVDYGKITNGGGNSNRVKNPNEATSSRLNKAFAMQGSDGTIEPEVRAPKTHEQHRVEVENSIRKEFGSVADIFNDNDFEYLTSLVENKVPVDIIADEIEHRLNHGEWYTIDESTPIKKATSSKLARILKNMGDDSRKAKNQVPQYPAKSHATITNEVGNTLEGEFAGLGLDTPTDIEFISLMLEENIPDWQIEDEINHRLMTGEWYSLDESIEPPKRMDSQIQKALNSLVDEGEQPAPVELTRDEIRERVRNTLENEAASLGEITDDDVDYLTNLKMNGATTEELAQALHTKAATGRFAVSPETQAYVNACFEYADKFDPNSRQACEAKALAYKKLAEEVVGDASPFEKFEAWRYLAMLGNPKTMLRNVVGNTLFNAVTGTSNTLSAVLEAGVDKLSRSLGGNGIQRTKSVLNPTKDGGLIKAAWDDADEKRHKQLQGSKYEKGSVRDKIAAEKSVFNSKFMKLYEKAVDAGISDYTAIKTKYSTSLAGWMKANGLDESAFGAEGKYQRLKNLSQTRMLTDAERAEMKSLKETMDALEKGRDYALKQAEYATFHEDNVIADAFSKASRYLLKNDHGAARALGYMMEGVVPFKKTPANILRSGFEYSPLGAIKSIADTGKLIYENTGRRKKNLGDTYTKKSFWCGNEKEVERSLASDVIDSWSKSLTGTGLAYLGYYLMSKGILNSSEPDEKYQDDLEGIQNYSITINGKTYTIDWSAPAVMPLLLGAEIQKIFNKEGIPDEKWYKNPDEIIDSINSLLNPVFETSMLQGIQNVLESASNEVKYNDDGAIGGILGSMATNAVTGYASQALPTMLGQIARSIDNTRRTTDTASDSNFLSGVEKQGRKMMNKIPGLSFLNPEYIDSYGRTQTNGPSNPLANTAYQFLSPAYVRDIKTTDADKMARDVYNAKDSEGRPINDKKVFAPWKGKVTYGNEKLDPQQMHDYREASGRASFAIREALANEDWFKELDGQAQSDILKKVNTLVNKVGLEAAGYPQTSKELDAFKDGQVPGLLDYYHKTEANKAVKAAGLSANSNAGKEIANQLVQGNKEEADRLTQEAVAQKAQKDKEKANKEAVKTDAEKAGVLKADGTPDTDHYNKVMERAESKSERMKRDFPELKKAGLPNSADYVYANAIKKDSSITVPEFTRTYNKIDTDKSDKLTQKEMLAYLNGMFPKDREKNMKKAEEYWNTYQDGTWKKSVYIKKDGTFGAK